MIFLLNQKSDKTLISNFLALSLVQVTNLLVPIISLPYIIRIIGLEKFGWVSLVQAIMTYFIILVDYGFNLTAVKEVAVSKNNPSSLEKIFNRVTFTKIFIALSSYIILALFVYLVPQFYQYRYLILLGYFLVFGQMVLPLWFFQGVEQMKYISYLNAGSKLFFLILIFVVVQKSSDDIYILFLFGAGNLLSGLLSTIFIFIHYKFRLRIPKVADIFLELKKGWDIFLAAFVVNVYVNSNILILGVFANKEIVGMYATAERIIMVIRQLLVVFSQTTYPRICNLYNQGMDYVNHFYKVYFRIFMAGIILMSLFTIIASDWIVWIIVGEFSPITSWLVRIMCLIPIIVGANVPAFQILLVNDYKKDYSAILLYGALLNTSLSFVFCFFFGVWGIISTMLLTESFVTISLYYVVKKKNIRLKI